MGYFWQGLPPFIIEWSKALLPSHSVAVETGTFQGETSLLLANEFGACTTIERSDHLFADAATRFASDPRVTVLHGSSRDRLAEALPSDNVGCFCWLDAHGIYDHAGDDMEENPLLFELETVASTRPGPRTVIAIDDARGMGAQPGWPPLADIFAVLSRHGYGVAIVDDCVVAAPLSAGPDFYALYRASRMVEVPAVFHVWPQIKGVVSIRKQTDRLVTAVRDRR